MQAEPRALKQEQETQWNSRAEVRLARADLIEKHWAAINDELLSLVGLAEGQSLLDVGTGHGEPAITAAHVVGPNGRVVGLDLSSEMLDAAKARAAAAGVTGIEWVAGDAEHLDLGLASFDAAVSRNCLMFLPRPVEGLRAVSRALRPGGAFAVAVVGAEETQAQWTMTVDAIVESLGVDPPPAGKVGEPGVYSVSSLTILEEMFEQAGYTDIVCSTHELVYDFDEPQELVTWHEINPTIMGLFAGQSEARAAAAWEAVVDAARDRVDADGHVRIPSDILYAVGRRAGG